MRAHALLILSLSLTATAPALAQNQPSPTRAERQVDSINRSMATQGEIRGMQQQNQFNNNQIRGEMMRNQAAPTISTPGIIGAPR